MGRISAMKNKVVRTIALLGSGLLFGILPGCVEMYLLNIATPFLLNQ